MLLSRAAERPERAAERPERAAERLGRPGRLSCLVALARALGLAQLAERALALVARGAV
jgi:hypothetical protein